MVATNSTSQTKKGTARSSKRSTVKKSDIKKNTKPKEPAGNDNKPHCDYAVCYRYQPVLLA